AGVPEAAAKRGQAEPAAGGKGAAGDAEVLPVHALARGAEVPRPEVHAQRRQPDDDRQGGGSELAPIQGRAEGVPEARAERPPLGRTRGWAMRDTRMSSAVTAEPMYRRRWRLDRPRRRLVAAIVLLVVASAIAVIVADPFAAGSGGGGSDNGSATSLATVTRRSLS